MLHIMSITAVIYYILASLKVMCELPDDPKVTCGNPCELTKDSNIVYNMCI
jgi:hypothetical protein